MKRPLAEERPNRVGNGLQSSPPTSPAVWVRGETLKRLARLTKPSLSLPCNLCLSPKVFRVEQIPLDLPCVGGCLVAQKHCFG